MSLPFSSHIWVLGTRAPSPSRLAAWAPVRVPCADQKRSGLAQAQVTRAGPYMERLPGRSATPPPRDPAQLPARGDGVGRGSPHAPVGTCVRLRSRSCTCPKGLPTPSAQLARALRRVPPTFQPFFGFTQICKTPHAARRRREPCLSDATERMGAGVTPSVLGTEGRRPPSPSPPVNFIFSPSTPEAPIQGLTQVGPCPHRGEGHRQREGEQLSRPKQLAAGGEDGEAGKRRRRHRAPGDRPGQRLWQGRAQSQGTGSCSPQ